MTRPWIHWNHGSDVVVPQDIRDRAESECARVIGLLDPEDPKHVDRVQDAIRSAWQWAHGLSLQSGVA